MLDSLLVLSVIGPSLAFNWGSLNGHLAFVLYREPKLIAVTILGWSLLSAFLWRRRAELEADEFFEVLRRPPIIAFGALLSYLTLTGLWVRVPQNHFYELNQLALLILLLVTLLLWTHRDPSVPWKIRIALITGLAINTVVGLGQIFVEFPLLSPIDPLSVRHGSLFGYKNPAALALLGQIFLLAELAFERRVVKLSRWRLVFAGLLALELIWLVSLRSRSAYAGLFVGALVLLAPRPGKFRSLRSLAATAGLLLAFTSAVTLYAPARERVATMFSYLTQPRAFLESDRGTYLLNTLNMTRYHPMGVGLGDWQTHYPVFRLHGRDIYFNEEFRVRRAHSDHTQVLGEAGWPGLALWLLFLAILIGGSIREYLRAGHPTSLYLAAQLTAITAAMATDYLFEMPYHKAQFVFVAFLALAARQRASSPTADRGSRKPAPKAFALAAFGLTIVALLQVGYHVGLARKIHLAAAIEKLYVDAAQSPLAGELDGNLAADLEICDLGRRFAALPGHTKTFHKDLLLIAHSSHRLGRRQQALAATRQSLALHPYNPDAYILMSLLVEDPQAAERWSEGAKYILNTATRGFLTP